MILDGILKSEQKGQMNKLMILEIVRYTTRKKSMIY